MNELLLANPPLSRGLRLRVTALLAAKHEVNSTTMNTLALASEREDHWLAVAAASGGD